MNNVKIKFRAPSLTEINSKILVIDDKEGDLYYKANKSIFKVATTLDLNDIEKNILNALPENDPIILSNVPSIPSDGSTVQIGKRDNDDQGTLRIQSSFGHVDIGPANSSFCHFMQSGASLGYYFNDTISVSGVISAYNSDLHLRCNRDTSKTRIILKNTTTNTLMELYGNLNVKAHGSSAGKIEADGDVIEFASDKRLKENIIEIPNPLDKIKQLRGVYYDWKKDVEEKGFHPSRKTNEIGMIAQEIEQIIPQAIEPAPFNKKYKTIKYNRIIPLLVECIKEQQKQIDELKSLFKP